MAFVRCQTASEDRYSRSGSRRRTEMLSGEPVGTNRSMARRFRESVLIFDTSDKSTPARGERASVAERGTVFGREFRFRPECHMGLKRAIRRGFRKKVIKRCRATALVEDVENFFERFIRSIPEFVHESLRQAALIFLLRLCPVRLVLPVVGSDGRRPHQFTVALRINAQFLQFMQRRATGRA